VRLLDTTLLCIGNEDYAKGNGSYGLSTSRNRHVKVSRQHVRLRFRGKSGIEREVDIHDPAVARLVNRLQELPGQHVFQYLDDDGVAHPVDSGVVNDYLREISGADFSAKDFRTWGAAVFATTALGCIELAEASTQRAHRAQMKTSIEAVARQLGHTPTVCRQSYIHPAIFAACESGILQRATNQLSRRSRATLEKLTLRLLKRDIVGANRGHWKHSTHALGKHPNDGDRHSRPARRRN
jgi:DNA topoisomerase-1